MTNEFLTEPPPPLRLFSTRAVGVGTFIGGPLTAGLFIGLNFRRLGNLRAANLTFAVGFAVTALIFWGLLSLPSEASERLPNHVIPPLLAALAAFLAKRMQGVAIKEALEQGALKASGWVITGWSVASLILTLGALVPLIWIIPPYDFHGEKHAFGPGGVYEMYCVGDVGQQETKGLEDFLMDCEYLSGDEFQVVQLAKTGSAYTLSLPVDHQYWDSSEVRTFYGKMKSDLERDVLKGKVILRLVDEDYRRSYRKEI